ncbi:hypothetical protein HAX54_026275, partial [Datura stramonium]|nr:hypothetical protein [Datura stramonium]
MRDQETDREGNGLLIIGWPSLEPFTELSTELFSSSEREDVIQLERSERAEKEARPTGREKMEVSFVSRLCWGGQGRWIGSRGDAYASSISIGFPSFSVYGEGDKREAPNMFYPQAPSIISNLNSSEVVDCPFLLISQIGLEPYTRGCLLLSPISKVAYALHLLPLNDEARSGRRDLNHQPQPWQGYALPLRYIRQLG